MLLQAQNIKKGFGIQELFDIEKLEIMEGDRIGLIGLNGAGKSTLLHVLYGSQEADEGSVSRCCEIAMIEQIQEGTKEADPQMKSRMQIKGSACKSGGEKTRLAIAAAISRGSRLLFADEPTTNLDMKGIETLEKILGGFKGAFVLISHDRYLLDKVCTAIWELEDGKIRQFPGSYSVWKEQKEREREFARFEFEQYQSQKKKLETAALQVKNEAAQMKKHPRQMGCSEWMLYKGIASDQQKNVQSRGKAMEKRLERIPVKEKPKELPPLTMRLGINHPLKGRNAITVNGLSIHYGSKIVLDQAQFQLTANKCTVLMGANGAGKSTLIHKILEEDPSIKLMPGVKIGYFSQEHETLDENKSVMENVCENSDMEKHLIRCILANLYLSEQHIFKPVSVLSGGERAKVMLAKVLVSNVNVLIFDEPTNHIDMYTAEALEGLLKQWEGTMLIVTHDRSLGKNIADRLAFVENGKITSFEGNWDQYIEEEKRKKRPKNDGQLNRTLLCMKMDELRNRLQHPRKGDDVLKMNEELERITSEYYKMN